MASFAGMIVVSAISLMAVLFYFFQLLNTENVVENVVENLRIKQQKKKLRLPNMGKVRDVDDDSLDKFFHLSSSDEEVRRSFNVLDGPVIIPADLEYQSLGQRRYLYRYIFSLLKRFTSDTILYPYPVTYKDNGIEHEIPHGGFINTRPWSERYWKQFNKNGSEVEFGQAKALYDFNIAVLKIQTEYNDQMTELLYESDRYCEMLVTFLGHYGKECLSADAYLNLDDKISPKFVYLSYEDLYILNEEPDKFGMFIIPDIILDADDFIYELIGDDGTDEIKTFVEDGGTLYASAKGGILLEKMGIFTSGVFLRDKILFSETNSVDIEGCLEDLPPVESQDYTDFVHRHLCFSVTDLDSNSYFLSSYIMSITKSQDSGLIPLTYFAKEGLSKKDTATGFSEPLSEMERGFLPQYLYKQYSKGLVIVNNAFPAHDTNSVHWFFNPLFLAMGKDLYFNTEVEIGNGQEDMPIPGNEAGVILKLKENIVNLYSHSMSNVKLSFWLPPKVSVYEITSACEMVPSLAPPITTQALNASGWICEWSSIGAMEKKTLDFKIEILDASVTRRRSGIQMLYNKISYKNTQTGKTEEMDIGSFYVTAKMSALLRPSVNPDPSSFYPIPGRGVYVDNVVPCQNVEHTPAYEVEYVSILPIVTPAVDGDDQGEMIVLVQFWEDYYKEEINGIDDYVYPFEDNDVDYDIIDYNFLSGRGSLLNADWDTPVKQAKVTVDDLSDVSVDVNTDQANYTSTNTNSYVVTEQRYYSDAKIFFEHATQRQLVFLDTTKPEGAENYYPELNPPNYPDGKISDPTTSQTEFIWVRSDIYFYYSDDQYTHPKGLELNDVVSLDQYPVNGGEYDNCDYDKQEAEIMIEGHFRSTESPGLVPNQYSNELLNNCQGPMYNSTMYREKVEFRDVEDISDGNVLKTHYLVPVTDDSVKRAGDIKYFIETSPDGMFGHLEPYPDVKYIHAYEIVFSISPDISRMGGQFKLSLNVSCSFDTDYPIENDYITYTADHIAVIKTEFEDNVITTYYKRGNMPNERWSSLESGIRINLEHFSCPWDNFVTDIELLELKFDISYFDGNFERYFHRETREIVGNLKAFFHLPAIKMVMKVQRGEDNDATILPYELLEPMSRYGFYFQELLTHSTVWGIAESHHVRDPGLTARNAGFSVISQVGISSIPFLEYVTAGKGQLIPSAPQTSRVDWNDLWGRRFSQPVRSVFPDVPPIPPPLRNFMLSTTFEVTLQEDGTRRMEWNSDEVLDVFLKLKLLNNYPKHFDITTCKENEVYGMITEDFRGPSSRIFEDPVNGSYPYQVSFDDDEYQVGLGHRAFYGSCFMEDGTVLEGEELDDNDFKLNSEHCNKILSPDSCKQFLDDRSIGYKILRRREDDEPEGSDFNFSPQIEDYYPEGYVKGNMWDLTHYDYDDNCFDISYKYHMDNRLPSFDNPGLWKPHNIIVQPLYKGFGYQMIYDKTYSVFRHPDYMGWWSDNLQNKDNTLIAGQEVANDVSVDKGPLVDKEEWIDIWNMKNFTESRIVDALENIYICLFNRQRVKMSPQHPRKFYPPNTYVNNVVPVKHRLTWDDLSAYPCDLATVHQYSNQNISQFDNRVYTNSARDWLYFSAALRGGSRETINVVYQLKAFEDDAHKRYEGDTKINEGGRFVYWNPANGPNSFLIVDNPVNIIKAIRSDIDMDVELFPKSSDPFQVRIYHLLEMYDLAERGRRFRDTYYINHYGYGDSLAWVYVGGIEGSRAIVQPGDTTYVRVTLGNNAGFDWNMRKEAMESVTIDQVPISAYELFNKIAHSVQVPTKYNFMTVEMDKDLEPYVTIEPSDHCAYIAPLFFDFQSINTVSIRDGFKADYFYKVTIHEDIPEELRGKLHEFKIKLNHQYFDHLPNCNTFDCTDPTEEEWKKKYHDYDFVIPPFKIGIPYSSENPNGYNGLVYYTNGFSTDMKYTHTIDDTYDVVGVKYITKNQINYLRWYAANPDSSYTNLLDFYNNTLTEEFTDWDYDDEEGELKLDLSNDFPEFPMHKDPLLPPVAETYLLVMTTADQVPFGTNELVKDAELTYTDYWEKERKSTMSEPDFRSVNIKGPWLMVEYICTLVEPSDVDDDDDDDDNDDDDVDDVDDDEDDDEDDQGDDDQGDQGDGGYKKMDNQYIYPKDGGYIEMIIKVTNIGDGVAHNVKYTLNMGRQITFKSSERGEEYVQNENKITFHTDVDLSPGVPQASRYYFQFNPLPELQNRTDYQFFPKNRMFVGYMDVTMDISEIECEKVAVQRVDQTYHIEYVLRALDEVFLKGVVDLENHKVLLKATANQPYFDENKILYMFMGPVSELVNVDDDDDGDDDAKRRASQMVINEEYVILQGPSEVDTLEYDYGSSTSGFEYNLYKVYTLDPVTMNHLAYSEWRYEDPNPWATILFLYVLTPLVFSSLCICFVILIVCVSLFCCLLICAFCGTGSCTLGSIGLKKKTGKRGKSSSKGREVSAAFVPSGSINSDDLKYSRLVEDEDDQQEMNEGTSSKGFAYVSPSDIQQRHTQMIGGGGGEEEEEDFDMSELLSEFGEEGKTAFIYEGRPVSIANWKELKLKPASKTKV